MTIENNEADSGASLSNEGLGAAVIVQGRIVAWFADSADFEWCTENYFGEWLTWRAKPPELVPMTDEEIAECERRAEEISAKLKPCDEAPNVELSGRPTPNDKEETGL